MGIAHLPARTQNRERMCPILLLVTETAQFCVELGSFELYSVIEHHEKLACRFSTIFDNYKASKKVFSIVLHTPSDTSLL